MLSLFLNLWYAIPMGWRYVLMGVPLLAGIIVSLATWDWIPLPIGGLGSLILFLLPGASQAEKKGYHF